MSEVETFRQAFREATGIDEEVPAFAFGDSPEMADELAALVVNGPKRATVGLLMEFDQDDEPRPHQGQHWIVLDGSGAPACVIRTLQVEVKPLREVDPAFAWDEGEGDRTLEWWRDAHRRYFARRGISPSDDLPAVFERFEVVWPRQDRPERLVDDGATIVRPLRYDERGWVRRLVTDVWAGPAVVSRGVLHEPDRLPGIVAERDGQPAGLVTFRPSRDDCELVTVNALVSGVGVGARLLEGMTVIARRQGWRRLWLISTNDNTPAIRFYQRQGWDLAALHHDALEQSRRLKPQIPPTGHDRIPIRHELEFELRLAQEPDE